MIIKNSTLHILKVLLSLLFASWFLAWMFCFRFAIRSELLQTSLSQPPCCEESPIFSRDSLFFFSFDKLLFVQLKERCPYLFWLQLGLSLVNFEHALFLARAENWRKIECRQVLYSKLGSTVSQNCVMKSSSKMYPDVSENTLNFSVDCILIQLLFVSKHYCLYLNTIVSYM